jgi:hypothetical protein
MMANVLIAGAFFVLGFIVGGVFVLKTCWDQLEKCAKNLKNAQSDPLIIRVYESKL